MAAARSSATGWPAASRGGLIHTVAAQRLTDDRIPVQVLDQRARRDVPAAETLAPQRHVSTMQRVEDRAGRYIEPFGQLVQVKALVDVQLADQLVTDPVAATASATRGVAAGRDAGRGERVDHASTRDSGLLGDGARGQLLLDVQPAQQLNRQVGDRAASVPRSPATGAQSPC